MLIECIVIFAILLAMMVIFLRTKKEYALTVIPLLIPTGANIIAYLLSEKIASFIPFDKLTTFAIINVTAVVISSFCVGLVCTRFKEKVNKVSYVVMSMLFNICLLIIFIYNYSIKM